ncbi:methyltransferase domain-containing protein [Parvularcula dongshanensis]|uniref:methyltransferase domain-containing protein n=1 Tax=Parvularcula dongshanensis TaxID=1173995 RepID=UPI003CCD170E
MVDLCCGTGINLGGLSAAVGLGGQVIGIDLSDGMLAKGVGIFNRQACRTSASSKRT